MIVTMGAPSRRIEYKERIVAQLKKDGVSDYKTQWPQMQNMLEIYRENWTKQRPNDADEINWAIDSLIDSYQYNYDKAVDKGEVAAVTSGSGDDAVEATPSGGMNKKLLIGGVAVAIIAGAVYMGMR